MAEVKDYSTAELIGSIKAMDADIAEMKAERAALHSSSRDIKMLLAKKKILDAKKKQLTRSLLQLENDWKQEWAEKGGNARLVDIRQTTQIRKLLMDELMTRGANESKSVEVQTEEVLPTIWEAPTRPRRRR